MHSSNSSLLIWGLFSANIDSQLIYFFLDWNPINEQLKLSDDASAFLNQSHELNNS